MPRVFNRQFRVRYYECDPYGHVNNANYLRYATQAATEASADAGYDPAKYDELRTTWWIREAGLTYLRPAAAGDTLHVKTWVSNFRRVRSRREYELTLADGGDPPTSPGTSLVAKGYTDWVYLDTQTGQPARIPAEMMAAFFPEGAPREAPKREPFPEPPPPLPGAFKAHRRVRWHQLDPAGHLNSAWYLSLLEDVAIDAAESGGWTMERSAEAGLAYFAREHRIEYLRPALMGDDLQITTYIGEFRRASATRHYRIEIGSGPNAGEVVARAQTLWVWVDAETGRPKAIPEELLIDFADQMAG